MLGPAVNRTVRVVNDPMPWWGWPWSDCGDEEATCDWWRENHHRAAAWQVTAINKLLKTAADKVPDVGTYDAKGEFFGGAISLAYWYATYVVPLCEAITSFAETISGEHFRSVFYARFSSPGCGASTGQCGSGGPAGGEHYYPVQYWEGVELAACATLQDILNTLKVHLHHLKAEAAATITGKEIQAALMGAEHLQDLNLGQYQAWGKQAQILGVDVDWDPTKAPTPFAGYKQKQEDKTGLDPLIQALLTKDKDTKAETNWTPILLGGAALAAVLLLKKPKATR